MEQPRAAGAPPEAASSLHLSALSIEQPRAARAPPERAFSLPQLSSPAQRELPQKEPPPPSPPSISPAQRELPQEAASSPPLWSSPAQRELRPKSSIFSPLSTYRASPRSGSSRPQMKPPPSLNGAAAPRSGSSHRSSVFSPSIEQPREFTKRAETASSLSQLSSPAQREAGAPSQSSSLRAPPVLPPCRIFIWRSLSTVLGFDPLTLTLV